MTADLLIPGILLLCAAAGLYRRENVYEALTDGALQGLSLLKTIVPSLVILLCAIGMLRASGAFDLLDRLLSPVCRVIRLPPEVLPLMLVRPFSGSAALAVGAELMTQYGVDSQIGRTAAVMLGSTETTFISALLNSAAPAMPFPPPSLPISPAFSVPRCSPGSFSRHRKRELRIPKAPSACQKNLLPR